MLRKLMTIGLSVVAVITLAAAGPDFGLLVDDFNDGDAAGWTESDYTGVGTFQVVDGAYTLETTEAVPVTDPSVGTIVGTWERSRGRRFFSNGTLEGTVRANAAGSTVGFILRANDQVHTNYGFYGSDGFGTFYIEQFDASANPPQAIIAMADKDKAPFEVGQDYRFQVSAVGSRLTMKVWKVGDPEPWAPLLTLTDRELPPGSGSLICVIGFFDPDPLLGVRDAVEVSGTFDDITFYPGPPRRPRRR